MKIEKRIEEYLNESKKLQLGKQLSKESKKYNIEILKDGSINVSDKSNKFRGSFDNLDVLLDTGLER